MIGRRLDEEFCNLHTKGRRHITIHTWNPHSRGFVPDYITVIVFQAEWHLTTILDNHLEIGKFIIDVLDATTRRCEGGSRDLPPPKGFVT